MTNVFVLSCFSNVNAKPLTNDCENLLRSGSDCLSTMLGLQVRLIRSVVPQRFMTNLISAPALGFLRGIFGGTVAQGLAFLRRRNRNLDRLRSVLQERRGISKRDLKSADSGHSEMTDENILLLQNELRDAHLQASYLLGENQRKRIDKVEKQFSLISHSAGNINTSLTNTQLADRFTEKSEDALDSLRWGTIKIWQ